MFFFSITDCYDPSGIGDGICDDYSNNKACNYDQGDCCTGIKGVLCNICECKQSSTDYPVITTEWDPYLSKWVQYISSICKLQRMLAQLPISYLCVYIAISTYIPGGKNL